ncbi:receptor-like protein 33 [Eucalyptus grandis]|uniref:receptor-like protein 33 n=1 Tax=Eucalyptus grandis TaxID=71139 RepID=UPI00192EB102|nr:receptor-like protein 33 [Eucalyptus grandis]
MCNATQLELIVLSNNGLTNSLPRCITNFSTNLSILDMQMNHLDGTIPQSFSFENNLTTINLSENWFEGTLPRSLVNCTNLEILDLRSNQIEDTFPRWLGKLPELKVLTLQSNNFKGLLNISKGDLIFPKLRILDLSNNNFGGPLPTDLIVNLKGMKSTIVGQGEPLYMPAHVGYENTVTVMFKGKETKLVKILTIFTTIDLSHNSFQGKIPKAFGHLHSLIGLNLSHNHLIGSIPLTLGNLTDLEWLDLSSNMLSGGIPRVLGDLAFLGYLNFSKNQLTGRIPQDKHLSTFSSEFFSGNPGLCGTPLPKACHGETQPPLPSSLSTLDGEGHESWFKRKVVWMGYASGIVVGISAAYIAIEMGWPKWLARGVRMLERSATQWMEKPKQRTIKFHGQ